MNGDDDVDDIFGASAPLPSLVNRVTIDQQPAPAAMPAQLALDLRPWRVCGVRGCARIVFAGRRSCSRGCRR